jgi:uncharacterized protein (TIGR04255 family)
MQFEELSDFRAIHLGLLWERLGGKAVFPGTEEHPPVPQTLEHFGIPISFAAPQFQILNIPPMPRQMFVSEDGTFVVQVQQNRFTVNWRRRLPEDEYPRFETILAKFELYASQFAAFLEDEALGSLRIKQAEVTYVNRIEASVPLGKIEEVISVFSGNYSDDFLPAPEEVHLALRYPMTEKDGPTLGRLYIDSGPGVSGDPKMPLNIVLLARGKPARDDIKGALDFFTIARSYIVSAFASVTSKQMHLTWNRTDNA